MLVDTHCHIHEVDYPLNAEEVIERAHQADVVKMICVGTSLASSCKAIQFANSHPNIFAAIGIHPSVVDDKDQTIKTLISDNKPNLLKLVAVGEIGLDYHDCAVPKTVQEEALEMQIQLALDYNLPIIFHVREAFDDFWPIFDNFHCIRGVMHSFTDTPLNAEAALNRDLFIGVNGFSTFTKNIAQQSMFANLPLTKIVLETDAPFLTPVPFRGKVNEPAFVRLVADNLGRLHQISIDEVATITTANASILFKI
jgi:TatD DNase family protein